MASVASTEARSSESCRVSLLTAAIEETVVHQMIDLEVGGDRFYDTVNYQGRDRVGLAL